MYTHLFCEDKVKTHNVGTNKTTGINVAELQTKTKASVRKKSKTQGTNEKGVRKLRKAESECRTNRKWGNCVVWEIVSFVGSMSFYYIKLSFYY